MAVPVYLTLFPRSAPSAFESEEQRAKKRATLVRMRTRGSLELLTTLEDQAAGGGGIALRPAKRKKAASAQCELAEQLLRSRSVSQALVYVQSSAQVPDPKAKTFKALQRIAKAQDRQPAQRRVGRTTGAGRIALDGLSQAALKAGCTIIGNSGPQLGVMRRGALGKHLEHLVMEDRALEAQGVDCLGRDELLEACIDRGFGSGQLNDSRLRKLLNEWLAVARSRAANHDGSGYEPHRLRLAMMATFAAAAVRREEDSMSVLPRLVYS
uniref:Letm1 RBD domain-containing protein n=1 Tax=Haptolina brevifila TaxID=156173 RepID=A0A7S2JL79_9EUKA|mmetsp:Transcript_84530/g.168813  ORF Transcript_84530/g.168813 Transcript_84530/m.168813 type:complete len:268 (+) Transcript_84530:535-1338(+)